MAVVLRNLDLCAVWTLCGYQGGVFTCYFAHRPISMWGPSSPSATCASRPQCCLAISSVLFPYHQTCLQFMIQIKIVILLNFLNNLPILTYPKIKCFCLIPPKQIMISLCSLTSKKSPMSFFCVQKISLHKIALCKTKIQF